MFEEKLEEMKKDVYGKNNNIIKTVIVILLALTVLILMFVLKSKIDYNTNKENLEKYAKEYYNENMKSVNPAAGYVISLQMLESVSKYDLKYFEKCDKKETSVDIYVDEKGNILSTKTHIKCK